jgi:hypothetical protein
VSNAVNPYAAPAARVEDVGANPEAEAIRRAHISHEASIKAIGLLYYLGGILVMVVAGASLLGVSSDLWSAALALVLVAVGVAQLFAGWGVRALRSWARTVGCVLSAIGLIGFPIGTLINGYILYLLLSKKGRTIFSPAYQNVIAATPDVKHRTSVVVWIFLALLAGLILVAFLAPVLSR